MPVSGTGNGARRRRLQLQRRGRSKRQRQRTGGHSTPMMSGRHWWTCEHGRVRSRPYGRWRRDWTTGRGSACGYLWLSSWCIVPSLFDDGRRRRTGGAGARDWLDAGRHPSGLSLIYAPSHQQRSVPDAAHRGTCGTTTLVRHPLSPLTPPHTAPAPCVRLVSPGGLQCLLLSAPIVVAVVPNVYAKTQVVTWLSKTDSGSK